MTLSKRLVIALGSIPVLLSAAAAVPQHKPEMPATEPMGSFWDMQEMENFFNRPFPHMNSMYGASSMKENEKAYLINIDLPGMDKKDISIETSENRLMVSGERKEESETQKESKRSVSQFRQSYLLPEDADFDAITATSLNGVLKITVPKNPNKKVSKKIEIK
jgi:HSP20 family protein